MADSLKKADSIRKTDSVKKTDSLNKIYTLNYKNFQGKDSSVIIKKDESEINQYVINKMTENPIKRNNSDKIVDSLKTNLFNDYPKNSNKLLEKYESKQKIEIDFNSSDKKGVFPTIKETLKSVLFFMIFSDNLNLTGFGKVFLGFYYFLIEFGLINAFILIIISNIMIFIKKWRFIKSILLIDIFGFLFLLGTKAELWGYWVCLYSWIGLIILDAVLIYKQKISSSMI